MVEIILVLIVVGVALYLINTMIPMDSKIKMILNIVVVLVICVWLLQVLGLVGPLHSVRVR